MLVGESVKEADINRQCRAAGAIQLVNDTRNDPRQQLDKQHGRVHPAQEVGALPTAGDEQFLQEDRAKHGMPMMEPNPRGSKAHPAAWGRRGAFYAACACGSLWPSTD